MKIKAIQSNYNINKKHRTVSFKAKSIDGSTIQGLKKVLIDETVNNLKSKYPIYDKFYRTFKNEGQHYIAESFMSCLNSDGSVSKDAIRMLYSLCGFKSPYLLDKIFSNKKHSQSYTYHCTVHYNQGLKNIADIIEACKDKNGNHQSENLYLANDLENKTNVVGKDLIVYAINLFKDENGIFTDKNREFYEYLSQNYPQNFAQLIQAMPDKNNNLSKSVKNFIESLNGSTVVNSDKFKEAHYIIDILKHTKNLDNRDEILDFISNSEYLKKNCPSISYYKDKDGNINLDYLKKYLELAKRDDIKNLKIPAYIYQSDKQDVLDKNIEQVSRFRSYHENDAVERFAKSKYFKKDGIINKEFVDFILENDYMFQNTDSYFAYPFIDTSLDLAKQKDGSINYEVASLLQNTGYKFAQNLNYKPEQQVKRINRMLMQISELCKNEKGEFTKENIILAIKEAQYIKDRLLFVDTKDKGDKYLNEIFIKHVTKDKNLYDSKVILDILNKGINYELLTTKIPEYENLLFAIADIPPNNNPATYKEIINILNSIETINYNIKDSHNISFLEKVLNSENKELLEVISHPSNTQLEYYPELDFAYQGIQDKEFKKQVDDKLHIRFPQMEEAIKLQSQKAWEKVEQQLDSPLCHKKDVLNQLWNIARKSHDREFCNYFALRFAKELPDSILNDLNKM